MALAMGTAFFTVNLGSHHTAIVIVAPDIDAGVGRISMLDSSEIWFSKFVTPIVGA